MPQRPKPELRMVEPLSMSATALSAESNSFDPRLSTFAATDNSVLLEVSVRRGASSSFLAQNVDGSCHATGRSASECRMLKRARGVRVTPLIVSKELKLVAQALKIEVAQRWDRWVCRRGVRGRF